MPEYTRQRQGRDFSLHNYLLETAARRRADENAKRNAESIEKTEEANKSLQDRLEQYKKEAERNAIPIDGHEPPERGRN